MTLADLKKKPIVGLSDGAKIGEVDDLSLDTTSWTVRDLVIDSKNGRGLLALANLKAIGPDAITIERSDVVAWNAQGSGLLFEALRKLIVVDASGTTLGHVKDLSYGSDGAVATFDVHQGGVLGLGVKVTTIDPTQIRAVGDRLLTVELPVVAAEPIPEA